MVRATHGSTTKKDRYRNDVPSPGLAVTVFGASYEDLLDKAKSSAAAYFGVIPEGKELATTEAFDANPSQYSTDGTCILYKATMNVQLRTLNPKYDPLAGTALEDDEDDEEDLEDDDEDD